MKKCRKHRMTLGIRQYWKLQNTGSLETPETWEYNGDSGRPQTREYKKSRIQPELWKTGNDQSPRAEKYVRICR